MISLPPGCTVTNNIRIQVNQLTDEMIVWFREVGGEVTVAPYYDFRGRRQEIRYVKYGRGKRCHISSNGDVTMHFQAEDSAVALGFIMMFMNDITRHNFPEYN